MFVCVFLLVCVYVVASCVNVITIITIFTNKSTIQTMMPMMMMLMFQNEAFAEQPKYIRVCLWRRLYF